LQFFMFITYFFGYYMLFLFIDWLTVYLAASKKDDSAFWKTIHDLTPNERADYLSRVISSINAWICCAAAVAATLYAW